MQTLGEAKKQISEIIDLYDNCPVSFEEDLVQGFFVLKIPVFVGLGHELEGKREEVLVYREEQET